MLEIFFQLTPIPADQIIGTYDIRLVALSYLVAVFASYIALDITSRLRDISNTQLSTTLWLCGGAFAMGAGIWSMHFIGMLAFSMPMPMNYDPYWTILSMIVAISASAFALYLLKAKIINLYHIVLGGIILGFAIAAMHYTGMAAMTNMHIHYIPSLFFLSIVIAIIASEAALWLALKSTEVVDSMRFRLKFVSAFIMGAAISGMHYTGMAAAVFTHSSSALSHTPGLNPQLLAMSVAAVTFIILSVAFLASTYKESLNQQMLLTARQAGMAEVAASVLHNVGNVLNSVNVSATILAEKNEQSKLAELSKLSELINQHQNNLSTFITNDPRGSHLPEYINKLADYWQKEQEEIATETRNLIKNIHHIKNIIATQQDLSRVSDSEQVLSLENVLEESILISGIETGTYHIKIERDYTKLKPIMVDKVKLLQILVNLIQNAKESLITNNTNNKRIQFTINQYNSYVQITVTDNGEGIASENLKRIFMYGFTTKKQGHGFGLHTSAISAKEMGGSLSANSEGIGKGATFTLKLPFRQVK